MSRESEERERWRRVRARFEDAVGRSEAEWPAIVAATPAEDRELLARMLAADAAPEPLLDRAHDDLANDLIPPKEPLPDRIGRYVVVRSLGRGGMGQVLLARPNDGFEPRDVAIKLLRRGMDSEDVLRRFRAERQILERLSHPNIARLLDAGISASGRPYFVMEYVPGAPITEYCQSRDLALDARLRLFAAACSAVQHAHEHGVVHRDLKPSNVIVADGSDPAGPAVKLLDFGIAKMLEPGGLDLTEIRTRTGLKLMTPEYASPEQVRGGDIGPSSDVYSLGVVLYELLSGNRPYELKGLSPAELERVVCEEPPPDLPNHDSRTPAALRKVLSAALHKDPERRYASAGALEEDVKRFLDREPVRARGDPVGYRAGRFVRRHRVGLALSTALLGVALAIAAVGERLAAGPFAPTDGDPRAVAVLPFRYEGPGDQAYYADALANDVSASLSGLPGLRVVTPHRVLPDPDSAAERAELGAELGASYLLTGRVRFERPTEPSGRVVVSPRLVRVADGRVVWSRTFDRPMKQIFAVQEAVARGAALALDVAGDAAGAAPGAPPTTNLEAYRFYLRGNDFRRFLEDEQRLRLAEASYRRAVALDSTFAEAWAALSVTETALWFNHFDRADSRLDEAWDAAERALKYDPGTPEAYYALGLFVYQGQGDLRQAQRYFERALELQPNHEDALVGLANVLRRQGHLEEAMSRYQELRAIDPLDPSFLFSEAFTQQLLRNYGEAEKLYAAAAADGADLPLLHGTWALLRLSRTGSVADARAVLEQGTGPAVYNDYTRYIALDLTLMDGQYREALQRVDAWKLDVLDAQPVYVPAAWLRARAYRGLGQPDSARAEERIAARVLEERVSSHPDDARAYGTLGRVDAALGRGDAAVRVAKRAVELQPQSSDAVLAPFRLEDLAAVYVATGRLDDAAAVMDSLLTRPSLLSQENIQADPRWAPLRGRPEFSAAH